MNILNLAPRPVTISEILLTFEEPGFWDMLVKFWWKLLPLIVIMFIAFRLLKKIIKSLLVRIVIYFILTAIFYIGLVYYFKIYWGQIEGIQLPF